MYCTEFRYLIMFIPLLITALCTPIADKLQHRLRVHVPCPSQAAVGVDRLPGQVQPHQRVCGAQPPAAHRTPSHAPAAASACVDLGGAACCGRAGRAGRPAVPRAATVQHPVCVGVGVFWCVCECGLVLVTTILVEPGHAQLCGNDLALGGLQDAVEDGGDGQPQHGGSRGSSRGSAFAAFRASAAGTGCSCLHACCTSFVGDGGWLVAADGNVVVVPALMARLSRLYTVCTMILHAAAWDTEAAI